MRATFQDLGRERVRGGGVGSVPGVSVEGHGMVELSLLPQTQWREVGLVEGGDFWLPVLAEIASSTALS